MSETASERGLRAAVHELSREFGGGAVSTDVGLERPPKPQFGDYSTNAALLLAPVAGAPARELAGQLGEALSQRLAGRLDRYEVAGPGFLNLFMADSWHRAALTAVLAAGEDYGGGAVQAPERVIVEFVSANPTGPMHVGHARNAAYGDALSRVLAFHGHQVEREFYVNDAGSQVFKLGESIAALARGEHVPDDGYRGDYVHDLASELENASSTPPSELGQAAVKVMIEHMQTALSEFRVKSFDHWAYESALHEPREGLHDGGTAVSPVAHALVLLEQGGHTYHEDGALWLRTTAFGDDKDRVLVRSGGEHTYFASDIAYHQEKRERGFHRQINVWGADHHGYVARMNAAYAALGGDPAELEMLIMQLVHLLRRGERAQMSKRAGEFVTLTDLIAEIGVDAARWYLLSRSHDTTIDLDLDMAREQSNENPVYYVQYAHARIASVLQKAGHGRSSGGLDYAGQDEEALDPAERALIKELLAFPGEVRTAAERRAPHRIAAYALLLAQTFTAFYRDCRVLEVQPATLEPRRLALCEASRRTLAQALGLLGVNAPDSM